MNRYAHVKLTPRGYEAFVVVCIDSKQPVSVVSRPA
jgi:hypothetical protein